ncbi:dTDP-4-dehydrorhamnose 3,5-epimerase family protein [Burkholderia stabilis]|uniref:dTDP-4-dehydrorhamnose 3,5-epimerase family protein n=1 Tax=Burkholderia stabilis TaxID=95485 RepID=UPI00158A4D9E|nr:dTDP-4-dehydrorhamnose 3,5-epimerase family protein [Burkholderia stabilis]
MAYTADDLNRAITIDGLMWTPRWRINNGRKGVYVIPFPTTYPVNIVYHGESEFKYGQYGIHLGQQDSLTFFGDETHLIHAKFIDCRVNSPTYHVAIELTFTPSSERTLIIPPGVAHTFHNLENVYTINSYSLFLPSVEQLSKENVDWSPASDVINLPENIAPADVPGYVPMTEEASDLVYHRIAEYQEINLKNHRFQHMETREFTLDTGEVVTLRIKEPLQGEAKKSTPHSKIQGVTFRPLSSIKTGKESCIVPLTRVSPMYVVEHGGECYDFNSYGLHLGQEDHLVFLGPSKQKITIKLVDMRDESPTKFAEEEISFYPEPDVELVIPCGVAHALYNLSNVFTVNRPVLYLDDAATYRPGHDVIDWPVADTNYRSFKPNTIPADLDFYESIVSKQKEIVATPATHGTPKTIVIYDENASKYVKVVLREKATA